ncbi:hypothetical protein HPP92_006517 [Vanilla planifolia]|uniref:Peroxidase n=1 Tax=Vanilla planifolia TaxID=51239 RepID=A0A835V6V0_VANPL|nr:hypothetical protein HPP92_006517 [Vanilla planifolia]
MATCRLTLLYAAALVFSLYPLLAASRLSPNFYDDACPRALPTIRFVVFAAIAREPRIGASLLRLHFHDCFVNGCDASVLLDDTATFVGEKTAGPNNNSLRGFDVVDEIKTAVNFACLGNMVSCADILAAAARDSVVALGGKEYEVQLGRRDSRTASLDDANKEIPAPFFDLPALVSSFESHGLSIRDLVVLSAAHTLGFARCTVFRDRLYNETIDPDLARYLQLQCPSIGGGGDIPAPLDGTPATFDTSYFEGLRQNRGLLHSDQQLFAGEGGEAAALVRYYGERAEVFGVDFGDAMIRLGSLAPLTGDDGEIRENCRFVN